MASSGCCGTAAVSAAAPCSGPDGRVRFRPAVGGGFGRSKRTGISPASAWRDGTPFGAFGGTARDATRGWSGGCSASGEWLAVMSGTVDDSGSRFRFFCAGSAVTPRGCREKKGWAVRDPACGPPLERGTAAVCKASRGTVFTDGRSAAGNSLPGPERPAGACCAAALERSARITASRGGPYAPVVPASGRLMAGPASASSANCKGAGVSGVAAGAGS